MFFAFRSRFFYGRAVARLFPIVLEVYRVVYVMVTNDATGLDNGQTDLRRDRLAFRTMGRCRCFFAWANEEDQLAIDFNGRQGVDPVYYVDFWLYGRFFGRQVVRFVRHFLSEGEGEHVICVLEDRSRIGRFLVIVRPPRFIGFFFRRMFCNLRVVVNCAFSVFGALYVYFQGIAMGVARDFGRTIVSSFWLQRERFTRNSGMFRLCLCAMFGRYGFERVDYRDFDFTSVSAVGQECNHWCVGFRAFS